MQNKGKTAFNKLHKELNKCAWCNASLPADKAFQRFHMLKVHGLVV